MYCYDDDAEWAELYQLIEYDIIISVLKKILKLYLYSAVIVVKP